MIEVEKDRIYSEWIKEYAFKLIVIHASYCNKCDTFFEEAVPASDTDMLPVFFDSVYSVETKTVVITELTRHEYLYGLHESMPKRISELFNNEQFIYIKNMVNCPTCNSLLEKNAPLELKKYIEKNPNVYLCYQDKKSNGSTILERLNKE